MSRYIDADKVKEYILSTGFYCDTEADRKHSAELIDELFPPADVVEVRHGRWEPFDLTWGRSVYFCTACNDASELPTFNGKPMYKYCPFCGAKMDEVSE